MTAAYSGGSHFSEKKNRPTWYLAITVSEINDQLSFHSDIFQNKQKGWHNVQEHPSFDITTSGLWSKSPISDISLASHATPKRVRKIFFVALKALFVWKDSWSYVENCHSLTKIKNKNNNEQPVLPEVKTPGACLNYMMNKYMTATLLVFLLWKHYINKDVLYRIPIVELFILIMKTWGRYCALKRCCLQEHLPVTPPQRITSNILHKDVPIIFFFF